MAISEKKYNAVAQNCYTIRQSLRQLQKSDSRTRTYLGSAYETAMNEFITPLNLRLVKNGRPDADLSQIQSDFSFAQSQFKEQYTTYMKELEALIAMDCQQHPDSFYGQLEVVRASREKLQKNVSRLAKLASSQYKAVSELKESL